MGVVLKRALPFIKLDGKRQKMLWEFNKDEYAAV